MVGHEAGKYQLMFFTGSVNPFVYNPSLVSADEFKSWKDLLNPNQRSRSLGAYFQD